MLKAGGQLWKANEVLRLDSIERLVLAWDPEFTKLMAEERAELEAARQEIENGETISHEAIDKD